MCILLQKHHKALSQETNTTVINSIFRAALVALQRPVAALLPFFAVMHSLRVVALAGEVLLTTGGHRAVITSRELGMHLLHTPYRHPCKAPWSAVLACVVSSITATATYRILTYVQTESLSAVAGCNCLCILLNAAALTINVHKHIMQVCQRITVECTPGCKLFVHHAKHSHKNCWWP